MGGVGGWVAGQGERAGIPLTLACAKAALVLPTSKQYSPRAFESRSEPALRLNGGGAGAARSPVDGIDRARHLYVQVEAWRKSLSLLFLSIVLLKTAVPPHTPELSENVTTRFEKSRISGSIRH